MPTGYTEAVQSGEVDTLREFAMSCSRAFGALIDMRDSPANAKIPERLEPRTEHLEKSIQRDEKELSLLRSLSKMEASERASEEAEKERTRIRERDKRIEEQRARYESMLSKVRGWTPPTKDHDEIKNFMIQQLESSLDFDCSTKYLQKEEEVPEMDGEEWRRNRCEVLERSISRTRTQIAEELERTRAKNDWIQELRRSLEE